MHNLSNNVERKYTDVESTTGWEILTDTGWEHLQDVKKTIEYTVYELILENDMCLKCADNHIVFLDDNIEVFVKDLMIGQEILTIDGLVKVKSNTNLNYTEIMYDVGVNSDNHRFYSNGILSHNSTVASAYLLWFAMFNPDTTSIVAAHKHAGALEIMQRIRFAYENIPDYIRSGVTSYNKKSIDFDNGARIVSQTTTENTGRGMSISCLDEETTTVTVMNSDTGDVTEISLKDLLNDL